MGVWSTAVGQICEIKLDVLWFLYVVERVITKYTVLFIYSIYIVYNYLLLFIAN